LQSISLDPLPIARRYGSAGGLAGMRSMQRPTGVDVCGNRPATPPSANEKTKENRLAAVSPNRQKFGK
jgi:hypothetical protein